MRKHMGDSYGKIVSYIIAILFMTLVPTMFILQASDKVVQGYVDNSVTQFVDTCRETGCVSETSYYNLIDSLNTTGYRYTIKITHYEKQANPNTEVDGEELVFQDGFIETYMGSYPYEVEETISTTTERAGVSYSMNKGDYLNVSVQSTENTLASKIARFFTLGAMSGIQIYGQDGGIVGTTYQNVAS